MALWSDDTTGADRSARWSRVQSWVPAVLAVSAGFVVIGMMYASYRTFVPEDQAGYSEAGMPVSFRVGRWIMSSSEASTAPAILLPVLAIAWLAQSRANWAPPVSDRVRHVAVTVAAVGAAWGLVKFLTTVVWLIVTHGVVVADPTADPDYGSFEMSVLTTLLGAGVTSVATALGCGAVAWIAWVVRPADVAPEVSARVGEQVPTTTPDLEDGTDDGVTPDPNPTVVVPHPRPVVRDLTPFVRPTAPIPTNGHVTPAAPPSDLRSPDPLSIFRRPG